MDDKVCMVCARPWAGRGRRCERCRKREQRGQSPVEPVAQLVECRGPSCGRVFAVPFGDQTPATCSGACEGRYLALETRRLELDAERQAVRDAWHERQASIDAPPEREVEPAYERQLVRRTDPLRPWQTVERWETVRVN